MNLRFILVLFLLVSSLFFNAQNTPNLVIQENHEFGIHKIAAHPYKDLVATADKNLVKIWDSRSWKILHTIPLIAEEEGYEEFVNLEFADSYLLVTIAEIAVDFRSGDFNSKRIPELRKTIVISTLDGQIVKVREEASNFLLRINGDSWVSIQQQDSILIFQTETYKIVQKVPSGNFKYILKEEEESRSWFLRAKTLEDLVCITFAKFSPQNKYLLCGYSEGTIELRNAETFELIQTQPTELSQIMDTHFLSDEMLVLEGMDEDDQLLQFDVKKKEVSEFKKLRCETLGGSNVDFLSYGVIEQMAEEFCHFGIDIHTESSWLAIGKQMNRIHLMNLKTGKVLFVDSEFNGVIADLKFTRDGKELLISEKYADGGKMWSYNLEIDDSYKIPTVSFDDSEVIGFMEKGDGIYILNAHSFNKWSLESLRKIQSNRSVTYARSGPTTKFLSTNNQYFIELPSYVGWYPETHQINFTDSVHTTLVYQTMRDENKELVKLVEGQIAFSKKVNSGEYFGYGFKNNHKPEQETPTFELNSEADFKISDNGRWLAYFQENEARLKIIDTQDWSEVFRMPIDRRIIGSFEIQKHFSFSQDEQRFAVFQDINEPINDKDDMPYLHKIRVYNLNSLKGHNFSEQEFKYNEPINLLQFGYDGRTVLVGLEEAPHNIQIWDWQKGKKIEDLVGHEKPIQLIADHAQLVFSKSEDNTYRLWDKKQSEEVFKMINAFDGTRSSEVFLNKEGYYFASQEGLKMVGYQIGEKGYPFEQLDLIRNRPDKVLADVPNADKKLVKAYKKAHTKRIENLGFSPNMLEENFNVPGIEVLPASNETATKERQVKFQVKASDEQDFLDRINIWVNGVPIFGRQGLSVRDKNLKKIEQEISIDLSIGENKIQFSAMNQGGGESLKETFTKNYVGTAEKPDLHLVVIAVSAFQDTTKNLDYPIIDMDTLVSLFQSKQSDYQQIHITELYQEDVTIENVEQLKNKLKKTKIDDKVIVAFAGHGVFDGNDNYFLSTHNIDFNAPENEGLPYSTLESLLDNIPARKKLLLIDACHSGEIDKSYINHIQKKNAQAEGIKFRQVGNTQPVYTQLGIDNSYELMKRLFVDLRRSTEAVVISSSGGVQPALESSNWGNSAFIKALTDALKAGKADGYLDKQPDQKITVSELSAYLFKEVSRLTKGLQQPTFRVVNLENDWQVW